jgi:hypothetical protein
VNSGVILGSEAFPHPETLGQKCPKNGVLAKDREQAGLLELVERSADFFCRCADFGGKHIPANRDDASSVGALLQAREKTPLDHRFAGLPASPSFGNVM